MYIFGFLFLFIGISLLIYTFLLFINSEKKQPNVSTKKEQEEPKTLDSLNTVIPIKNEQPLIESPVEVKKQESLNQEIKDINHKPKIQTEKESTKKEQKQIFVSNLDLFLTGYLYYDLTRSTIILLEKRDKTSSEYLSNLNRLGNATLEWKVNTFVINYDENKIYLNYENIQEIRFCDECAIFIPNKNHLPYYYFFSNQIDELKEFLKELSKFV